MRDSWKITGGKSLSTYSRQRRFYLLFTDIMERIFTEAIESSSSEFEDYEYLGSEQQELN